MFKLAITLALTFTFFAELQYSQSQYDFKCGSNSSYSGVLTPLGMGLTKPMKTLPKDDLNKYFRVLMIYVEFLNDNEGSTSYWAPNSLPVYANQLFAPQKQLGINAYEQYKISDYFNKVSRDEFDIVGDVYHVILDHEYSYYQNNPNGCYQEAQLDAFRKLDADPSFNWSRYDRWKWRDDIQQYEQTQDNFIDMIYIQHRRVDMCGITSGGYGFLGVDYTTRDGKQISGAAISYTGSGVTGINGANMPIEAAIGYFRHEYCHYTLGYHKAYSTIGGGDGTQTAFGYELGFAPMDMIAVGYANVQTFSGLNNNFNIGDQHSTGDIIKIPTSTNNEFFLVANRQRIVGDNNGKIYDCNMGGDTAMGNPFLQFRDYSKGLYIYHVSNGDNHEFTQDLECADGLWDWSLTGTSTPDWSNQQILPVFTKTYVGYLDDNPYSFVNDNSRMTSRDGHSVDDFTNSIGTGFHNKWFSIGKRHSGLGQQGIDRIFTLNEQNYCSRETMGDRWDAWQIGYNVIFSPYSSPNTKDRNNNNTGIFVYYKQQNGNTANIEVYQAAANTQQEDAILQMTPPSKPMGVNINRCFMPFGDTYFRNKITWNHNMEPDMNRDMGLGSFVKRYRIYRSATEDLTNVPNIANATLLATVDINSSAEPEFVDLSMPAGCNEPPDVGCPPICWYYNNVRYYVEAVDKYNDVSVKSDFVSSSAWRITSNFGGGIGDNKIIQELIPDKFILKQNYPNPFNPTTEINFGIPQNSFVTIKVYNAIGEEIAILVNNVYKSAGTYNVIFDGTNYPSGIYYYSIEAGTLKDVKKMILIK